uniref:Uncharacterized protein n=1 Tax=Micrurus corallinus TaxID=54390 RepID=A0A2D4EMU7_MICCO
MFCFFLFDGTHCLTVLVLDTGNDTLVCVCVWKHKHTLATCFPYVKFLTLTNSEHVPCQYPNCSSSHKGSELVYFSTLLLQSHNLFQITSCANSSCNLEVLYSDAIINSKVSKLSLFAT